MPSRDQRVRIRILVKAFPQHSQKYDETVCCAGITDAGRLIRLFPIIYRRLPKECRFNRYDEIEAIITKATSDSRPESFRIDQPSIRIVEPGKNMSDEAKVRLWQPHVAPSLDALQQENRASARSLGIIRPDPGSLKFFHRKSEADEQAGVHGVQASLFDDPLRPLAPPEYVFGFRYTSAGRGHEHTIQDWEVQAAYVNFVKRYGSPDAALSMLTQEYGEHIAAGHPHFVMGTMKVHPTTFILIGILRSGLDPEELARQGSLL